MVLSDAQLRCHSCSESECGAEELGRSDCSAGSDLCLHASVTKDGDTATYKSCANETLCEQVRQECDDLRASQQPDSSCEVFCCNLDLCNHASDAGSSLSLLVTVLSIVCSVIIYS